MTRRFDMWFRSVRLEPAPVLKTGGRGPSAPARRGDGYVRYLSSLPNEWILIPFIQRFVIADHTFCMIMSKNKRKCLFVSYSANAMCKLIIFGGQEHKSDVSLAQLVFALIFTLLNELSSLLIRNRARPNNPTMKLKGDISLR